MESDDMEKLICFLNTNSGALSVLITAVYTIATIAILWANGKSARAAASQLEEMKRQFYESNRAKIEVELIYQKRSVYGLRFTNNGSSTAQNVHIDLSEEFVDSITEVDFSRLLKRQKDKTCIIGVGQHHDIYFGSNAFRQKQGKIPASGIVRYVTNGKQEELSFYIDLENYMTFYSMNSEHDEMIDQMKQQSKELAIIHSSIDKLEETIKRGKKQ